MKEDVQEITLIRKPLIFLCDCWVLHILQLHGVVICARDRSQATVVMGAIHLTQIFLIIGYHVGQNYDGYDPKCHRDVANTVQSVKICPTTAEENEEAALRKACNNISTECTTFSYHCLVNRFFNDTYEFCSPSRQIIYSPDSLDALCAEFNKGGGVIQGSRHPKGHCKTCPKVYFSNEAYKYSECYDRVIREVENIISETEREHQESTTVVLTNDTLNNKSTTEITTTDSTVAVDNTEKTENNKRKIGALLGILLSVAFVACVAAVGCCIKRRLGRGSPWTTLIKNDSQIENFKKWTQMKQSKRQPRRRCISENDTVNYFQIKHSPDNLSKDKDISLDEPHESMPLLDRKKADKKDFKTSLDGVENCILKEENETFGSNTCKANRPIRCELSKFRYPVSCVDKREATNPSELAVAKTNVTPRRRVKSESGANDIRISGSSLWLSSIAEDDNCDKKSFKFCNR